MMFDNLFHLFVINLLRLCPRQILFYFRTMGILILEKYLLFWTKYWDCAALLDPLFVSSGDRFLHMTGLQHLGHKYWRLKTISRNISFILMGKTGLYIVIWLHVFIVPTVLLNIDLFDILLGYFFSPTRTSWYIFGKNLILIISRNGICNKLTIRIINKARLVSFGLFIRFCRYLWFVRGDSLWYGSLRILSLRSLQCWLI